MPDVEVVQKSFARPLYLFNQCAIIPSSMDGQKTFLRAEKLRGANNPLSEN
jgi:hypothetical protein